MPIPSNQVRIAEIHTIGAIAAGGSSARQTDVVFHWRRTTISGPLVKTDIELHYQASIVVPLAAALNVRWSQLFNTVRFPDDALDPPLQVSEVAVGAIAGDSMTTFEAAFLLIRSSLRGRSYRGGKHLAPMSETDTTVATSDVFNAACLARLATLAAAIMAGFNDGNGNLWLPCILSRKLSQLRTNPTTVVTTDATQVLVNKRVGRMKKRQVSSVY